MAVSVLNNTICDTSTLANFKSWAQAISTFLGSSAGWLQSSDTGQVNWSTISTPPGTGVYVYEMWQPNDGLTNFYMKVEYGNLGSNTPVMRISVGTGTNGAGGLTGYTMGGYATQNTGSSGNTNPYTSRLSGSPGRFVAYLWENGPFSIIFSVERSLNSSGVYTSTHVTLMHSCWQYNTGYGSGPFQQSLVFGVGAAVLVSDPNLGNGPSGWSSTRYMEAAVYANTIFWNQFGFDLMIPYVGYYDNQLTNIGMANNSTVHGTFTCNVYGSSHTYYVTSFNNQNAGLHNSLDTYNGVVVMRHD